MILRRFAVPAFALPILAVLAPVVAAEVRPLVEVPVPLVLKDGRLARVAIYSFAFARGSAEPLPGVRDELERLAARWATDCFLSAQIIGHVDPGAGKDGDTLAAHRLARARADRLHSVLRQHGLPDKAIASVWDWQFLVPESRVTLWIFELVPGDDCHGAPLVNQRPSPQGEPRPLVARRQQTAQEAAAQAAQQLSKPSAPSGPGAAPASAVALHATGHPHASAEPASSANKPDMPAPPRAEDASKMVADVAAEQAAGADEGERSPAPAADVPLAMAQTSADGGEELVLELVFGVNSSFLTQEDSQKLREFLERLGEGRFAVRLEGAVAEGGVARARTPEEARRYNEWIATRRIIRVREWLERHAAGRIVGVEQAFLQNDPSRRVVIRVRHLPR